MSPVTPLTLTFYTDQSIFVQGGPVGLLPILQPSLEEESPPSPSHLPQWHQVQLPAVDPELCLPRGGNSCTERCRCFPCGGQGVAGERTV